MKPTALILAGGLGSRMGLIGKKIPKCLLRIHGRPILAHTLEKMIQAGFTRVVVSTRKEHAKAVRNVAAEFYDKATVQIIENPYHNTSLIQGLAALPRYVEIQEPFLLCLGDVMFAGNPFTRVKIEKTDVLYGYPIKPDAYSRQYQGAMFIDPKTRRLLALEKFCSHMPMTGMQWSGMALCSHTFWKDTEVLAARHTDVPLEILFQYRLKHLKVVHTERSGPFFNINTTSHLMEARGFSHYV